MKKKKELVVEKKANIFTIPSEDAKKYLSIIIRDVKTILSNDNFMEATKKVKLPPNATIEDYSRLVKRVAPEKIGKFLTLFLDDCFDEVRSVLGAIFITDLEEYKKKSIKEMCEDISTLTSDEVLSIIRFFHR